MTSHLDLFDKSAKLFPLLAINLERSGEILTPGEGTVPSNLIAITSTLGIVFSVTIWV